MAEAVKIPVVLDDGAILPKKAHPTDAGLDMRTPQDFDVVAGGAAFCDTGVHVAIPEGYVGLLLSTSGLNCKHGITSRGVIDCGYTGSIGVKLYNHSNKDYHFRAGDKISQLVILPTPVVETVVVSSLETTDRGDGGFGSTGR